MLKINQGNPGAVGVFLFLPCMGALIYSISLRFYSLAIHLAALVNPKAKAFVDGRKSQSALLPTINPAREKLIWMHCASLGEFEQGRPVLQALGKQHPHHKVVLTFFSPSGYAIHKDNPIADHVLYLPLDSRRNAETWVDALSPSIALFVKYEFWHYYTLALSERNIPVLSISSIFRKTQPFFRWYGSFQRNILKRFTHFFVQDTRSEILLREIQISNISVAGDTRFDRVYENRQAVGSLESISLFLGDYKDTWVVGSAWPEDMEVLLPFIQSSSSRFIIAPHEINESFIKSIEEGLPGLTVRYSKLAKESTGRILIIDNVGMLASLYQFARYAWIGGAYGKGLHNTLEASVYGIPVFFGDKNYRKFREAMLMIERGGAFPISDTANLKHKYATVQNEATYHQIKETNEAIVRENLGATQMILEFCNGILSQ